MKIRSLVFVGVSCILAGQVMAQFPRNPEEPELCGIYQRNALQETGLNRNLRCGFTGPRWTPDTFGHYQWCRRSKPESAIEETVARLRQLDSCNHAAMCEQYASNASNEGDLNNRFRCGFGGPRYESTLEGHKTWCLSAREDSVMEEVRGRYRDMYRCFDFCGVYSREAVRQNREREGRGCRLSGPRWSNDREGHFRWCMVSREESVKQEWGIRANQARSCRPG
jgi:hypothetical protein